MKNTKKTRRILATVLAVLVLAAMLPAAFAGEARNPARVPTQTPDFDQSFAADTDREMWNLPGTIVEIGENTILIKTILGEEMILNISDTTIFVDNKTREIKGFSDVKAGESVIAYYSPVMTRSLPPMTNCFAIIMNTGDLSTANLVRVAEITVLDDGIKFLTADGDYIITVSKDTPVAEIGSAGALSPADIREGDLLFAWFGIVATSYPGQTWADAVLIVPADSEGPTGDIPAADESAPDSLFIKFATVMCRFMEAVGGSEGSGK